MMKFACAMFFALTAYTANAEPCEIYFDPENGLGPGVLGGLVNTVHEQCGGWEEVMLYITSHGGDNYVARGIHDLLRKHHVKTVALGPVISAGVTVFLAGENREIAPNAVILFHEGSTYGSENQDQGDLREAYLLMQEDDNSYVTMIAERTGMSIDEVQKLMAERRPIGAEEAVRLGFAEKIW